MNDTTTICGVVVNYNYARFLRRSMQSLVDQTEPFDQLVFVDDGSLDESLAIADEFAAHYEIVASTNGGQLSACRVALDRVRCSYVYFLDADDEADSHLVETVRNGLDSAPAKVQFQLRGVDASGEELHSLFPRFANGYDAEAMRRDNAVKGFYTCPPTSGNVFRAESLRELELGAIDGRDFIDGPPALVMPYVGDVHTIARPLARYRVHGDNHSQWDSPTPELLAWEVERLCRRWTDSMKLLRNPDVQMPDLHGASFVLERAFLASSLRGGTDRVRPGRRLLAHLWAHRDVENGKGPRLLMVLALLLLPLRSRRYMIKAMRSPVNRPAWINALFVRLRERRTRYGRR